VTAFHHQQTPIDEEDLSPALSGNTMGMGVMGLSENQRGELELTEISRQLTTGGGKPGQGYPTAVVDARVRRLTPTECERLQGFPDGWTDHLSDAHRYRCLGNAVAVPVAEWIGRRIMGPP
jgi:DNA (cytosine-5)-methyltransferase 1